MVALQVLLLSLVCSTTLASDHRLLRGDFECKELFIELDENQDGALTKTDLATYLSAQGGLSHLEIDEYLSDVDPRATLGLAEFCHEKKKIAWKEEEWKQKRADHKKKTAALKKAAGFLTYTVAQVEPVPISDCRGVFDYLDADSNGSLNREDVTTAFNATNPNSDIETLVNNFFSNNDGETMNYDQFRAQFCEPSNASARQEETEESSSSSSSSTESSSTKTRSSSTDTRSSYRSWSYRQDSDSDEPPSRDTPSRDTPSRDTPSRDTPSRDTPSRSRGSGGGSPVVRYRWDYDDD